MLRKTERSRDSLPLCQHWAPWSTQSVCDFQVRKGMAFEAKTHLAFPPFILVVCMIIQNAKERIYQLGFPCIFPSCIPTYLPINGTMCVMALIESPNPTAQDFDESSLVPIPSPTSLVLIFPPYLMFAFLYQLFKNRKSKYSFASCQVCYTLIYDEQDDNVGPSKE